MPVSSPSKKSRPALVLPPMPVVKEEPNKPPRRRRVAGRAAASESCLPDLVEAIEKDRAEAGKGCTEGEVAVMARRLGVELPAAYRGFLREFGWARLGDEEVFGVSGRGGPSYTAASFTRTFRGTKNLQWPMEVVCIADDGRGGCYGLEISATKDGESPIVYFDHERATVDARTGQVTPKFRRVAVSFERWIARLIRENK